MEKDGLMHVPYIMSIYKSDTLNDSMCVVAQLVTTHRVDLPYTCSIVIGCHRFVLKRNQLGTDT